MDMPSAGDCAAYIATFIASTTILGVLASMLEPVAGLVDDIAKIGQDIPLNAVEGKYEQTGGDLLKSGKGLTPDANIWNLKTAIDHMIFNQIQEYFSPGYLR